MFDPRALRPVIFALGAGLAILALAYQAKGFATLFRNGNDLRLRWVEERYFYKGDNPYDVSFSNSSLAGLHEQAQRSVPIDPVLGPESSLPNYPPWYYGWASLFFWPQSWRVICLAYTLLNIALIGWITFWAWLETEGKSLEWRLFIVASTLAISAYTSCLGNGQLSILATGALCGMLRAERKGRWTSGIYLGVALLKPSLAAFHFLILIFRQSYRAIFACLGFIAVGSVVTWIATQTPPWLMLSQMLTGASIQIGLGGEGPLRMLSALNVNHKLLALGMPACFFTIGLVALFFQQRDLLAQFAIACVINRFSFFHSLYDNITLIFILVALGRKAFDPFRPYYALGFFLIAVSLWIPGSIVYSRLDVQIGQSLAWLAGLFILVVPEEFLFFSKKDAGLKA